MSNMKSKQKKNKEQFNGQDKGEQNAALWSGVGQERREKKHKKEEVGKYNFTSISKMKESSI